MSTTIPLQMEDELLRFKEDVKAYTVALEQCARAPKEAIFFFNPEGC